MTITGNKGEWSEAYAFFRLLADGKLFAADEQLNRIQGMFIPILKIIREEISGTRYEYRTDTPDSKIEIYLNGKYLLSVPTAVFDAEASNLYAKISVNSGAFGVAQSESFMRSIYMTKLKAPSADKSDIKVQIHDTHTGLKPIVGFSIKSELGSRPTLLNSSRATTFVYEVIGLNKLDVRLINAIDTRTKIIDRVKAIKDNGGRLVYTNMLSPTFCNNLEMIDSQMPRIVAEMLSGYYSGGTADCADLANYICRVNPLSRVTDSADFYKHKIKEMLCSIALGMKPATVWNGADEASGGYIIVKTDGDVLAYHVYNRDAFKGYLLNNTKLDRPSTSRHGYCVLYEDSRKIKINLNLQIRFR